MNIIFGCKSLFVFSQILWLHMFLSILNIFKFLYSFTLYGCACYNNFFPTHTEFCIWNRILLTLPSCVTSSLFHQFFFMIQFCYLCRIWNPELVFGDGGCMMHLDQNFVQRLVCQCDTMHHTPKNSTKWHPEKRHLVLVASFLPC